MKPDAVDEPSTSATTRPCNGRPGDCEAKCNLGSQESCVTFGLALERGEAMPKDSPRAAAMFRRACEGGLPIGCGALGGMYLKGSGVARDVQRGVALYEEACTRGDSLSCESLGGLHGGLDSRAVDSELLAAFPIDLAKARFWYEKACALDNADACTTLGAFLADGAGGGEKDPVRAFQLFTKSCDAKQAVACKLLGDAYLRGEGTEKNAARSRELYRKACERGNARACSALERPPP